MTATLTEGLRGVASGLRAGVQMHPAARVAWLRAWTDSLGPGIVVLERAAHGTHHYPATGLLYRPASPSIVLTAPELELGEAMEFRSRNLDGAIDAYARSARSRDPVLTAQALLRLGRALRKGGRSDSALAVYGKLARLDSVTIEGVPVAAAARMVPNLARKQEIA